MSRVNKLTVISAAIPYFLLGYPWFSIFRDTWFYGGGLTVEQLQNGPSLPVAFIVAIASSLVTSYVLAFIILATGKQTILHGIKIAFILWLGFVAAVMGTQYTFEARTIGYFAVTSGYPLLALIIMGAIIGGWRTK